MIAFSLGTFSVLLAILAAIYLQLPTFVLPLGYRWFHSYKSKRWLLRVVAVVVFILYQCSHPPVWAAIVLAVPFLFFLIFSLLNANPKVYIALNEEQILKGKRNIYPENTEVLGYADDSGSAIAYPLQELVKPRHLLNDVFKGSPLFISYCMACRSAMVYNPVVNDVRLIFEVLGVYRRNMVMSDLNTGTVWQQGTGEAMYGKLKGSRLQYLPYQQMALKEWLAVYPHSLIAYESDTVRDGIFSKDRLMKMMKVTEHLVAPGKTGLEGLPLRETVFGVQVGDKAKAYPISELQRVQGGFKDFIGNTGVIVEYNPNSNYMSVKDARTGIPLVVQSHWWFGWKEFHPETEIWRANKAI